MLSNQQIQCNPWENAEWADRPYVTVIVYWPGRPRWMRVKPEDFWRCHIIDWSMWRCPGIFSTAQFFFHQCSSLWVSGGNPTSLGAWFASELLLMSSHPDGRGTPEKNQMGLYVKLEKLLRNISIYLVLGVLGFENKCTLRPRERNATCSVVHSFVHIYLCI